MEGNPIFNDFISLYTKIENMEGFGDLISNQTFSVILGRSCPWL